VTEACPICASPDTRIRYPLSTWNIAVCSTCGFEFHDGFGGGGGEGGTFDADYYTKVQDKAFEQQFGDYTKDPSAPVFARWLDGIATRGGKGRLLDVGSALGTFLKIAESKGFAPEGVEISKFASDFAREKRGLKVFNGDLEQFGGKDASFDTITFWDSIEHVTHPLQNLRTARRLLRTGGVLLLTTDNFDCLVADVARAMYHASLGTLTYAMERVFIAPNRSYFTESTMRALLATCGFRVLELEKMEYPIDKIRTNPLERVILGAFYGAAHLLNRQAQITVLATTA
jgi:2-polyprenyl-3-methyl-5-hydroxy-6-metoxy-1,4-benzoquinol methylase